MCETPRSVRPTMQFNQVGAGSEALIDHANVKEWPDGYQ